MIPYKYISTNDIRCIIISNAIYNSSKCDGNIADIPMCFKKKDNDGTPKKIQYPYISLICGDQPFTIKRGMNSRQLLYMDVDKVISLGICWEQAFKELVQQTDAPIYILGDVYLRFKDFFDNIDGGNTFFIIEEDTHIDKAGNIFGS